MLQSLHIQNYALIEQLDIDLSDGFVVLTGETGAGKSIILGALGLLLGERANSASIGNSDKKCIVEGDFFIKNYQLNHFFEDENLDYEDTTIIRRELLPSGKSRAFINDTPVNLSTLKRLTSQLIDIHSQHQNLEIEQENFQFQLVDSIAQNADELAKYQATFSALQKLQKQKKDLLEAQQQQSADIDYWKFQLSELQSANLQADEQEKLETESNFFSQLEDIQYALSNADKFLNGEESPIANLQNVATTFRKFKDTHKAFSNLAERLESCQIELSDIAQEISMENENVQNDPERATFVSERLDTIYQLQQKHRKGTITELLELQGELEEKVSQVENFEEYLATLDKQLTTQEVETEKFASALSKTRKKVIPNIEKGIIKKLQFLGIPNAKLSLQLNESTTYRKLGKEHLSILFSANKNMPLSHIAEVASGGELSRLMLTIKQLMAKSLTLPTLIFDEIDTGVSGEIADKMAGMMQEMGQQMQIITITHLPQVAAKASQHWEVYKIDTSERTQTSIQELKNEKRIAALAKMLSGSQLTDEAIANAKALLNQSQN